MLKSKLFLLLLVCGFMVSAQQTVKDFTLQNIASIKTIEPDSANFSDLDVIGGAIGNARIVMLGEQDHGDAPSFLAKTRIIKYLHEKLGFDVLVFESDFWALNQVWNQINTAGCSTDSIRDNTYNIWAQCVQVQPLYNYINNSSHSLKPLIVAGMDCRHAGPYSKLAFTAQFDTVVLFHSIFKTDTAILNRFKSILAEVIKNEYESNASRANKRFFLSVLDSLAATSQLDSFWTQELSNLKAYVINAWLGYMPGAAKKPLRDIQMADNLVWLYRNQLKGKKIIVWAHNIHISRNTTQGRHKIFSYNQTTGNELYNKLKDTVYTLGFTSYSGRAGRLPYKPYPIRPPKGNCFENWVHSKGVNYGFVNFKSYSTPVQFNMQGLSHWDVKAGWTNIFDGIFYIQDMYPCDRVKHADNH